VGINQAKEQHHENWKNRPEYQPPALAPLLKKQSMGYRQDLLEQQRRIVINHGVFVVVM
jgi:hypothetical protein